MLPPPPPPLDPAQVPGTEEWARRQLQTIMAADDAKAVTDIVAWYLAQPYVPGLGEARVYYARVCHERRWAGHTARLAWACVEALLKPVEDDIPF